MGPQLAQPEGQLQDTDRQATTDTAQKGKLHSLQLLGIGNKVAMTL